MVKLFHTPCRSGSPHGVRGAAVASASVVLGLRVGKRRGQGPDSKRNHKDYPETSTAHHNLLSTPCSAQPAANRLIIPLGHPYQAGERGWALLRLSVLRSTVSSQGGGGNRFRPNEKDGAREECVMHEPISCDASAGNRDEPCFSPWARRLRW